MGRLSLADQSPAREHSIAANLNTIYLSHNYWPVVRLSHSREVAQALSLL